MRSFGLTPDSVLTRAANTAVDSSRSLASAMVQGGLSFGAVSVLAYAIWAYRLIPGAGAMYTAIAAVYVGLSGLALGRLVMGPGVVGRFALLFAAAFTLYAVVWCAFWFGLRGKHHADLYGAAVGLALMAWLIPRAFGRCDGFLAMFGVLFACHTLGYTLGDELHAAFSGATGRLLWGAAHGLGFGTGLGYVVHEAQEPLRRRLTAN